MEIMLAELEALAASKVENEFPYLSGPALSISFTISYFSVFDNPWYFPSLLSGILSRI